MAPTSRAKGLGIPHSHCYRHMTDERPAGSMLVGFGPCRQTPAHFIHTSDVGSWLYQHRPWIAHMTRFFAAWNSSSRRAK